MIPSVLAQYNGAVHTTTNVTPDDAAKLDWESPGGREAILEIRATIRSKAHFDVKYPLVSVGDRVKILRKPGKYGDFKSHFVAWSEVSYRVEAVDYDAGNPVFKLEGRPKALRLHEILKVDGVEKAPKLKIRGKQEVSAQLRRKPASPSEGPSVGPSAAPPVNQSMGPPVAQATPRIKTEEASSSIVVPVGAPTSNPRLRTKTFDPKWAEIPVAKQGVRRRTKTFDPSWHEGQVAHPLTSQIFSQV